MILSTTLLDLAINGLGGRAYINFLDVCYDQGFSLDELLSEIWKDTLNDY